LLEERGAVGLEPVGGGLGRLLVVHAGRMVTVREWCGNGGGAGEVSTEPQIGPTMLV
jgi:hypothetical protein